MRGNNLTPKEQLNNRFRNLFGYSYEELTTEIDEKILKHKEQLTNYLAEPSEIKAYIDTHRYDFALPFAVIEIDEIFHQRGNDGKYSNPAHKEYCSFFKNYVDTFFILENIEKYVQSIKDTKSKITYLTCLKIKFLSKNINWQKHYDRAQGLLAGFNLELANLETQLLSEQNEKMEKGKRNFGGSQYQNLLAIHYLLEYVKAKNNKSARARFSSFLTGYSKNTFYNDGFNIHEKQDDDGVKWEKDMVIVKKFFDDLGLDEITRMIENDLNNW